MRALLDFFFPPFCEICKAKTEGSFLCSLCWSLCEPREPKEYCPSCFSELKQGGYCPKCKRGVVFPCAFVFESTAPAKRLCRNIGETALGLSGFCLYQWAALQWPWPNVVIPLPGMQPVARAFADGLSLIEKDPPFLQREKTVLLLGVRPFFECLPSLFYEEFPEKAFALTLFASA